MDPDILDYLEVNIHVGNEILFTKRQGDHDDPTEESSTKDQTDSESDEIFIDFSQINHGVPIHFQETILQSKPDTSDSLIPYYDSDREDNENMELHKIKRNKRIKNESDTSDYFIPYSDSDSEDNENIELHKIKRKKRTRNEHKWKRNLKQNNRLCGKEYVAVRNIVIEDREDNENMELHKRKKRIKNESDTSDSFIPYSDSDSEDNENIELHKIKRNKRTRNEHKWKRNVRQNNRLCGKEYVSVRNVVIEGKSMKPPCYDKCRLKCSQRFTQEQRLKIYSEYWKKKTWNLKRKFVLSCVRTYPVVRHRKRDNTRKIKTKTHKFIFKINKKEEVVCKTFFLNTLCITSKFMAYALEKASEDSLMTPD